ncbi:sigma factor-like helix-turn-helix DNA-binding protein [Streptomyces sp. SCSIO 30461]|uniref:sigma factor-like helix-turn-helix DNA-binding protein n=1 Tax=Streptomyces sp. SCSIO 30461 TaxID=3118085 RepID=UPI0030CFE20B
MRQRRQNPLPAPAPTYRQGRGHAHTRVTYSAGDFDVFVAGAARRLLHAATLLTCERPPHNPEAQRLLVAALAHTYADWDRLRGEDPYDRTRAALVARFARSAWRHHCDAGLGPTARLSPQERLVVVLRIYEGVAEEQTAALLGIPAERVRAICARAVSVLRHPGSRAHGARSWWCPRTRPPLRAARTS